LADGETDGGASGRFVDESGGDFFPAGAGLADGIWGDDVNDFFAEFGFATSDLVLETQTFFEEFGEDLFFGDVGDFLTLDVDDAATIAGEDGDVCTLTFAGAVDDAAHDGDFHGELDFLGQGLADILDEGEEIDLDAAAGGAGDEINALAFAKAEGVEEFEAILNFVDGVVGVTDADGVADAATEKGRKSGDAADAAGFLWAGVGHAEVEGMIEAVGDFGVGIDDHGGIHALGADGDVVEILLIEDVEILLKLGDHDGEHVAVLTIAEDCAEFLHALLLIFALDDGALVDTDADGEVAGFAGLNDIDDLGAIVDIAGIEADLVNTGLDGFEGTLKVKVDIGDDGDLDLREDLTEGIGVFFLRHSDADDVCTGGDELVDLADAGIDIVGVATGHGLDADGGGSCWCSVLAWFAAADQEGADAGITDRDLTSRTAGEHKGW
jgi:hypothetical protein